jgi:4-amino-4-deoxy-L-arabinose transferase-like glycosyltransferase
LAAYRQMPGIVDVWRRELSREAHDADPFYQYLIDIPTVLLPWTPLMLVGAWMAVRARVWRTPLGQFLLCWAVPGIVALHFGGQKSKHYPIPMLPPLSIVGAFGLIWVVKVQQANPRAKRLAGAILWALGVAAAAVAVFFIRKTKPMAGEIAVVLSFLAVGGVVAIWREARKDLEGQLAAILGTAVAMIAGINVLIIGRHFDDFDFARRFAREVNATVPEGERIYVIDAQRRVDPQVVYYLRGPVWRFGDEEGFVEFARGYRGGAIHVVGVERHAGAIVPAGDVSIVARAPRKERREEAHHRWVLYEVRPR